MTFRKGLWLFVIIGLSVVTGVVVLCAPLVWNLLSNLNQDRLGDIDSLAVSPDGAFVASGHGRGSLSVWDPSTGTRVIIGGRSRLGMEELAISHDGRFIATGSRWYDQKGGSVGVYDRTTRKWIVQREDACFYPSLAFHPSEPILAYGTADDSISLFDVRTGRETKRLASGRLRPSTLAFSPDGRHLAVAALNTKEFHGHAVALWEIEGDRKVAEFTGHETWSMEVGFSADGRQVASIGLGDALIIWDVSTRNIVQKIAHIRPSSFSFGANETSILVGHDGGNIREVSLKDGAIVKDWAVPGSRKRLVRCDPKGRYVACASRTAVTFLPAQ